MAPSQRRFVVRWYGHRHRWRYLPWSALDGARSCSFYHRWSVHRQGGYRIIVKVAIELLRRGIGDLLEQSLPDEVEEEILRLAGSVDGVNMPHALRTRRIGNHYAIELHILMDADITLREAHDKASEVEQLLRSRYGRETHIAVHVEPLLP